MSILPIRAQHYCPVLCPTMVQLLQKKDCLDGKGKECATISQRGILSNLYLTTPIQEGINLSIFFRMTFSVHVLEINKRAVNFAETVIVSGCRIDCRKRKWYPKNLTTKIVLPDHWKAFNLEIRMKDPQNFEHGHISFSYIGGVLIPFPQADPYFHVSHLKVIHYSHLPSIKL
ncbi:hypothetical protein RF11_13468 [Thelohanellus kitauei]|uniref:Uncharacterized protein n=1 Tax=Thelohanellus kitauei TaxID=669202 RepID=A0A0C2JCR9_THEKT|nr:hypothetical protein RF11_13468 [Thelohanellus kitauei]